jgi:hypothetical protein
LPTDAPNEIIPTRVEWDDEDQQVALLNTIDRANREGKLTADLPFPRQQRYKIYEAVRDDLESYQPATLP